MKKFFMLFVMHAFAFGNMDLPNPYCDLETILPQDFEPVWFNKRKERILTRLMNQYNVKTVVELGSWRGSSTAFIGHYLERKGGVIYAVDNWTGGTELYYQTELKHLLPTLYQQFLSNMISEGLCDIVRPVRADTKEAVTLLSHVQPDLIFVDASHDYESVYSDICVWYPFVRDHGLICGDDIDNAKGVKKAVKQFAEENNLVVNIQGAIWWYTK